MFRRSTYFFLCVNLSIVAYLFYAFSTLISLIFESTLAEAIHPAELPGPSSDLLRDNSSAVVPKIIHQTYKNASIPLRWQEGQRSCIDLHPDYTYMLWTDDGARDFIEKEYRWFLDTFDAYPYPIQRADVIRYFVLSFYGGIYIDLDDGCQRRLDPLLSFPAWVRRTLPTGISNDAMGAVPNHPFFLRVVESLQHYQRDWLMPYITVMYSTGPLFLSVIWKEYMKEGPERADRVRILMPDEYSKQPWSFFMISKGSSWHAGDAKTIFWMGQHWMLLTGIGFAAAGIVAVSLWWMWNALVGKGHAGDRSPAWKAVSFNGDSRRRLCGWFLRGDADLRNHAYDLIDRTA